MARHCVDMKLRNLIVTILPLAFSSCGGGLVQDGRATAPSPGTTAAPLDSPNRIAFSSMRDGSAQLFMISVDEANLTRVTDLEQAVTYADWSHDGTRIVAVLRVDSWNFDIAVLAPDGSLLSLLTDSPNVLDTEPDWSPDGTTIAFASDQTRFVDPRAGIDIYIVSSDGQELTRLTDSLTWGRENVETFIEPRQWNTSPDWSPDGQLLAFRSNRDGNDEIYLMAADGSGALNLTNHPARDTHPAWSPDGSLIAFVSDRDGNDEIYVMTHDGSELTRLTNNPGMDTYPKWSPDGKRIAFYSEIPGNNNPDIYVMMADGTGRSQLTTHPDFDGYPEWVLDPQFD